MEDNERSEESYFIEINFLKKTKGFIFLKRSFKLLQPHGGS